MNSLKRSLAIATTVLLSLVSCMPPSGADGKGGSGQSAMGPFILILPMILVFWLFIIRPQAKRAKNQKKFIEELQKGDKIVTIAGIHGTINKINDDGTLQVEISPGSYIKMERSAISLEMTSALNKPAVAEKK